MHWDVECVDCRELLGLSDTPRVRSFMVALIEHAATMAALAPLAEGTRGGFTVHVCFDRAPIDLSFFEKHQGHRLRPRNQNHEYGDAKCDVEYLCPLCNKHVTCIRWDHPGTPDAHTHFNLTVCEMHYIQTVQYVR